MKHPFVEQADMLRELIKVQKAHDQRNDGVNLYSEQDMKRMRLEIVELERLALIDELAS
jgi:hypothetical protein